MRRTIWSGLMLSVALAQSSVVWAEDTGSNTGAMAEYSRYVALNTRPNMSQFPEMIDYLHTYPNTGWSDRLKQTWAEYLAGQNQWHMLRQYAGLFNKGEAQCWAWRSYLKTDTTLEEEWYSAVKQNWKTQLNVSPTCQVAHQQLVQTGRLSPDDWAERVYFALSSPKIKIATLHNWLNDMPEQAQRDTKQLLAEISQPAHAIHEALAQVTHSDTPSPKALHHALLILRHLAQTDPKAAHQHWQTLTQKVAVHALIRAPFERHLFWQLSKTDKDNAVAWLQQIPTSQQDETTLTPILNQAWQNSDWSLLLNTVRQLPSAQQKQDRWQYWQAKALQQLGQTEAAQPLWTALAQQRSYYGFLAADRLGKPYQLNAQYVSEEAMSRVAHAPFLAQLKALYEANLKDVAWREWRYRVISGAIALKDVPAFAQHALQWGWADFSVLSMGNPQHWDYVTLRFPMPYRSLLEANSQTNQVPLAWAYAITRRESAYNAGVTSHSGAIGLMQLMPKTAKMVANALGTSIKHKQEIYQPERNVQLGTKHLSQLINGFDQHYVLATAAYNAGGGRVKQWLKRYPNLATDQWIELIAFKETRDYVKAVMEYWVVFERLGNLPPTQLAQYIVPLPKQVDASANDLALTASLPSESNEAPSSTAEAGNGSSNQNTSTPSGSGSIFDWF